MAHPRGPNRNSTGPQSSDDITDNIRRVNELKKRTKGMNLDQFLDELARFDEPDPK